jgi:hypothetical protein
VTSGTLREAEIEVAPHVRPFRVEHGEHHGVAQRTVRHDHVIAQHAVLLRTQPRDGGARLQVEPVRAELHHDALHGFEGVGQ